jgi:hypothetical protein
MASNSVNAFEVRAVVRNGLKNNRYTINDRLKARTTPFASINFLISFDDIIFE